MRALLTAAVLLAAAAPAAAQTQPTPDAGAPPSAGAPAGGGYGGDGAGRPPPSPAMLAARRAARQQCAADTARLCPDAAQPAVAPPAEGEAQGAGRRGGMFQCVRQHVSELSPGCRQALDAMRAARGQGGSPPVAPQG